MAASESRESGMGCWKDWAVGRVPSAARQRRCKASLGVWRRAGVTGEPSGEEVRAVAVPGRGGEAGGRVAGMVGQEGRNLRCGGGGWGEWGGWSDAVAGYLFKGGKGMKGGGGPIGAPIEMSEIAKLWQGGCNRRRRWRECGT